MPWSPATTLLGTHAELESFTHTIQYYDESTTPGVPDPITGEVGAGTTNQTYYNVRVIPQETNPSTISFTSDNPGSIFGYYKGIFNDTLTTRDTFGNFTTVTTLTGGDGGVFDKVNRETLHEVISFKADMTRSRTFNYRAEAFDPLNPVIVVAFQNYTVLAQDQNWTPGLNNLKELVNYASSK